MSAIRLLNHAISYAKTQKGVTSVHVQKDTSFRRMGEAAKVKRHFFLCFNYSFTCHPGSIPTGCRGDLMLFSCIQVVLLWGWCYTGTSPLPTSCGWWREARNREVPVWQQQHPSKFATSASRVSWSMAGPAQGQISWLWVDGAGSSDGLPTLSLGQLFHSFIQDGF